MAAKQQGKQKAKALKGRKLQKKHQLAKWKQKFQLQKQKKLQSRMKNKVKAVSIKICSPRLFASRLLRQMPKVRMEAKARSLMKSLLIDLYDQVATKVQNLTQKSDSCKISCTDVQTALNDAMTKELVKHAAEDPTPNCA